MSERWNLQAIDNEWDGIYTADGELLARSVPGTTTGLRIVTAVNAHDALVAAIKEAVRRIPYLDANLDVIKQCDAALTLAKSTEQDNGDPSEPGHSDNPRSNYDEVRDRL